MKIREMVAKAKDRIFGKKEPGKETGKDVQESAQKAQEQRKDEKTDFLSLEAEKRQEGAKNDATGEDQTFGEKAVKALENAMQKIREMEEDERLRKQQELLELVAEQTGISSKELSERLSVAAESITAAWETFIERMKPVIDATVLAFRYYYGGLDKWQLEKLKMSNNERRRRGIPMVRRRAYLQAEKNRRRRAREK